MQHRCIKTGFTFENYFTHKSTDFHSNWYIFEQCVTRFLSRISNVRNSQVQQNDFYRNFLPNSLEKNVLGANYFAMRTFSKSFV